MISLSLSPSLRDPWTWFNRQIHTKFLPLGENVFLRKETDVSEQFFAFGIEENLCGNHFYAVRFAGVGIHPYVNKLDVHPPGIFLFQFLQISTRQSVRN